MLFSRLYRKSTFAIFNCMKSFKKNARTLIPLLLESRFEAGRFVHTTKPSPITVTQGASCVAATMDGATGVAVDGHITTVPQDPSGRKGKRAWAESLET